MELTLKMYDTEISVKTKFDDVGIDNMFQHFEALLIGATFHKETIEQYYVERAEEIVGENKID
jgi:hypothetical protein